MRAYWTIPVLASILVLGVFVPMQNADASFGAVNLFDGNGFLWDIFGDFISNGTVDAYDGGHRLFINGLFQNFFSFTTEDGGREVVTNTNTVNGLEVNRKIFVPTDDAFARFLEILNNPTTSDISVTVEILTNLGSDGFTNIIDTSSGDTTFTTADDFIVTDDFNGGGDPTIVHAFSCDGATVEPTQVSISRDNVRYSYFVTVPAGERVIIMNFGSQNQNQATAAASALTLLNLEGSTLASLSSDEIDDIVNYDCSIGQSDAVFLVIDEDSIDNGDPPNFFEDGTINNDIADIGLRTQLPFFADNVGEIITLHTGEVGDEGWFALKTIPDSWNGLDNFISAGPGLGSGDNPEDLLDKIPDVTPLRAAGLKLLEGIPVCAVVYDSDISINYGPLDGSLKGANLGIVAFEVISANPPMDLSSSSLPPMQIEILDAEEVCEGEFELFEDAPEPESSSEPFDVEP